MGTQATDDYFHSFLSPSKDLFSTHHLLFSTRHLNNLVGIQFSSVSRTLIAWFDLKLISYLITPLRADILKQILDPFNQNNLLILILMV